MSNTNWDCSVCGKPVEEHTTELAKAHYERLMTPTAEEQMAELSAAVRAFGMTVQEACEQMLRNLGIGQRDGSF